MTAAHDGKEVTVVSDERLRELRNYYDTAARPQNGWTMALVMALSELLASRAEIARHRAAMQDTADLLIAINKDMHARNPGAVTGIDVWLAERALPAPAATIPLGEATADNGELVERLRIGADSLDEHGHALARGDDQTRDMLTHCERAMREALSRLTTPPVEREGDALDAAEHRTIATMERRLLGEKRWTCMLNDKIAALSDALVRAVEDPAQLEDRWFDDAAKLVKKWPRLRPDVAIDAAMPPAPSTAKEGQT